VLLGAFGTYWAVHRQRVRSLQDLPQPPKSPSVKTPEAQDEIPGAPSGSGTRDVEAVRHEIPGGRVLIEARGEGVQGVNRPGGRVAGSY